jgi:hypothetical protein
MRSQAVPSAIINWMIQASESRLPDISRPHKGCVVGNPALQPGHMQYAAFGVHLVDFHPASLRYALGMAKHQEQQATGAHLVPAALSRFNQPLNLAAGEVFSVAVPPPVFPALRPFCSPPFIILSRV